jgi:hypothetical protein
MSALFIVIALYIWKIRIEKTPIPYHKTWREIERKQNKIRAI